LSYFFKKSGVEKMKNMSKKQVKTKDLLNALGTFGLIVFNKFLIIFSRRDNRCQ